MVADRLIIGDDCQTPEPSLRNQQAIERIGMRPGQIRHGEAVLTGCRELLEPAADISSWIRCSARGGSFSVPLAALMATPHALAWPR
jgi:hypothetical protein